MHGRGPERVSGQGHRLDSIAERAVRGHKVAVPLRRRCPNRIAMYSTGRSHAPGGGQARDTTGCSRPTRCPRSTESGACSRRGICTCSLSDQR
eukprot:8949809-Pyramimonas_sp.AAC.2